MPLINAFSSKDIRRTKASLKWDVVVAVILLSLVFVLSFAAIDMAAMFELGDVVTIDLNPVMLPYYALRTVMRMFIALFFSFVFAFVFGSMAAKNRAAEKIIIPAIDVMQSIPVIGFLEITFIWFLYLFKGSFLGPECASIFAVFISQVWNLILAYYQSLKMIPRELDELVSIYRLSPWQRFFRLEVPFSAPGLIWNAMLSLSAGWFFVVASEVISIANHEVSLPGIGSYIATATNVGNYTAFYYAIACLFLVIMLYDQLIFRPLNYWLSKQNDSEGVLRPNRLWQIILQSSLVYAFIGVLRLCKRVVEKTQSTLPSFKPVRRASSKLPMLLLLALSIYAVLEFISYLYVARSILSLSDVIETITLGGFTALRVFVLVLLCCVVWVPVGVYLGMNERVSDIMQPIIQFLAAFPPNMLYPLVAAFIIGKGYNPNIWLSPLMVLGTQWYILFNVIAGVRALPKELLLMAKSFNLSGLALYKRVILPGMLPSLLTGVITAAGGAWNASIIAEVADWQGEVVYAKGLGAYIMYASRNADTHLVYLGVIVMCIYVLVINRLVWLPLYRLIEKKYGGGK